MILEQRGWEFHKEDELPEDSYYTYRFGAPIYGLVTPVSQNTFDAVICDEENDEPLVEVLSDTGDLDFVKYVTIRELSVLLKKWQSQLRTDLAEMSKDVAF